MEAEAVGDLLAVVFDERGVSVAEVGGAGGDVVRVGGEEVHPVMLEEEMGGGFGAGSEAAEERAGGDLDDASVADPLVHHLGLGLEGGVALGMGEDGNDSAGDELVEGLADGGRDAVVGELDEQVLMVVDGVFAGVAELVLDVVVGEMEVAAEAEGDESGNGGLDLGEAFAVDLGVVGPAVVGVRGADDVRDAVGGGRLDHGAGGFEVLGAVVEAIEQMVVNVDHSGFSV